MEVKRWAKQKEEWLFRQIWMWFRRHWKCWMSGVQMPSVTVTERNFQQNWRKPAQRFMQLIIPPERIMPGQRPIRKKSSRCISWHLFTRQYRILWRSIWWIICIRICWRWIQEMISEDGGKSLTGLQGKLSVQRNGHTMKKTEMLWSGRRKSFMSIR